MWTTLTVPTPATAASTASTAPTTPSLLTAPPPPTANGTGSVNASGYLIDDEPEEIGLSELQTVALACVATLIPLALGLLAVCGIRLMWRRWRGVSDDERTLRRTESSDPNRSSHLLLPDEIKTSESQFSVIPAEELEEVMTAYSSDPGGIPPSHNHTSKSTANGSIITMTMKNNHLIVETEEPMAYGQAIIGGESAVIDEGEEDDEDDEDDEEEEVSGSHREAGDSRRGSGRALVHREAEVPGGPNTGLSQSDLSLSSGGSANPGYCYGNQKEYVPDDRDSTLLQVVPSLPPSATSRRPKPAVPFVVQPSQEVVDDDELYLEQQRQLGNGLNDQATPPPPTGFQ